jgi:hypothetical protein
MGKTPIVAGMTGALFIEALNNNLGVWKEIVSDQPGADYSSLNAAIAAIGDIKIFLIDSPVVLSANISFPADVTIIIGAQGSLSGAYTLTGNKTTLKFEGKNTAIASDITFAGTWLTDDVDVNNFAVVADGVTDDRAALSKAFDFTRLTHRKRIVMNGVYKLSDGIVVSNTCIVGNPKFIGTTGKSTLGGSGSAGSFYALNANANLADYSIVCTNSTFLASIVEGDLLLVSTNVVYADSCNGGEIVEIVLIDVETGTIYFKAPLHLDYATSDGAKVARISPITFSNVGLITIELPVDTVGDVNVDKYSAGIKFTYGNNIDINVATLKTGGWGCVFASCYRPRVRFRGTQGETAGYGYGVSVVGATMFADVTGSAFGYRHCVHHGGTTDGVPWESHIHDYYATVMLAAGATAFDTHPSTGSVVFANCVAQGDSTYSGSLVGFLVNGKNTSLINCEARNLGVGAMATDETGKTISINGLRCVDVNYGFLIGSYAVVDHLDLKNIRVINSTLRTGAVIFLGAGTVNNLTLSGIHGYNLTNLIYITTGGNYPTKLEIRDVSLINASDSGSYAIRLNDVNVTELLIDGIVCKKCNYVLQVLQALPVCIIRNFEIRETGSVNTFTFSGNVGTLMLSNGSVKAPVSASSRIVNCAENITNLAIVNVVVSGTNMEYFTNVVSGKTFTNFFHNGNVVIDAITGFHAAQTPTNTITSGSVGIS